MYWIRITLSLIVLSLALGCTGEKTSPAASNQAQLIIDQAIEAHGGDRFANSKYQFEFRGKLYAWQTGEGRYLYTRSFEDSSGQIVDHLSNDGFYRTLNGERILTSHEQDSMYSNSVNSVFYFIRLPHGLNDPAANKKYLGEESNKGKKYHKIEVTFEEEGGGKDFDDIFVYWFEQNNHTLDYLAYSYATDGGGLRFRKAYNARELGGIRFQDYVNYKAELQAGRGSAELGQLYERNQLDSLSSIINESVSLQ
ncbi:MAG: DUF6503 family protein [Bacteroidia bacterium]